jgi:hypothetical protein
MYLSVRASTVLHAVIRNHGHRGQVVSAQHSMHDSFLVSANITVILAPPAGKLALKEEEEIIRLHLTPCRNAMACREDAKFVKPDRSSSTLWALKGRMGADYLVHN